MRLNKKKLIELYESAETEDEGLMLCKDMVVDFFKVGDKPDAQYFDCCQSFERLLNRIMNYTRSHDEV